MTFLCYVDSPYDPCVFTVPIVAHDEHDLSSVFYKFLGSRGYLLLDYSVLDYEE